MCSHYEAIREKERLERRFGVKFPDDWDPTRDDVWPTYKAAFIRRPREADEAPDDEAVPSRALEQGQFGLLPHWAKDKNFGRKTFNARSETMDKLPSFRDAWKKGQRCIIPADAFYEPDWRSGKAVPTRFTLADGEPMGIAGLWSWWKPKEGGDELLSFSMITINADDHPLLKDYHDPKDEKRMIVVLPPDAWDNWLAAPAGQGAEYLVQYPADQLVAEARPR